MNGHEAVVKVLLDNNAQLDLQDFWGKTALTWAKERSHSRVVKLLEQAGAKVSEERGGKKEKPVRKVSVKFSSNTLNAIFMPNELLNKVVVLLPTRSGMGGNASDEPVTRSLNHNFKKVFHDSTIITDDEIDKYFTDNNRWDDYFSYIQHYSAKGIFGESDLESRQNFMRRSNRTILSP
jgi:hypothetical protein